MINKKTRFSASVGLLASIAVCLSASHATAQEKDKQAKRYSYATKGLMEFQSKGELADVVISLKGITGKSTGASAAPVVIDQKGCLYTPTIVAVQTGQKIIVKNSDQCVHNVHDKPTVAGNNESNDVQMPMLAGRAGLKACAVSEVNSDTIQNSHYTRNDMR